MMSNDGDAIVDDDAEFSLGVFGAVQNGALAHLFCYVVSVRIKVPRRHLDLLLITVMLIRGLITMISLFSNLLKSLLIFLDFLFGGGLSKNVTCPLVYCALGKLCSCCRLDHCLTKSL